MLCCVEMNEHTQTHTKFAIKEYFFFFFLLYKWFHICLAWIDALLKTFIFHLKIANILCNITISIFCLLAFCSFHLSFILFYYTKAYSFMLFALLFLILNKIFISSCLYMSVCVCAKLETIIDVFLCVVWKIESFKICMNNF